MSSDWNLISNDWDGIRKYARNNDAGGVDIKMVADVQPVLDANKAMRNHNDGYSPSRELRRVAHIPNWLRLKWINEEGWDYQDPQYADRLARKLNDSDWSDLRTADGRLGISNGIIR